MRAKLAKALRSIARRQTVGKPVIEYGPQVVFGATATGKPIHRKKSDIVGGGVLERRTRVLTDCTRGTYQALKRKVLKTKRGQS